MLYVLPPPVGPSPSPWPGVMCTAGGSDARSRSGSKGASRDPWNEVASAVGPSAKRPPRSRSLRVKSKRKESGAGISVDEEDGNRNKSLSECYFAGKGAALVLPPNERVRPGRRLSSSGSDIQQHLQSMFYLLRPEETLKMAVKLESVHPGRTRYLVVVSCTGRQDAEECCLLGIDCNERTTVGLVLRVLADTAITLDGDGGFSVSVCGRQHIFKPVSVQAMWSALQTIHKVSSKAREQNYFLGGLTHDWVGYYEQRIESDRSCLNEWHAMDSIESRRPPSPDSVRTKPRQREETERVIRCTLKEIMMSVDLDEVTSKHIRGRLEEDLDMDLGEFKPFIDEEMLTILGQMDAATEIFDHVYLGSEWNASNHEELQKNGVRHILNVTREIDNFFPGMFDYLNIRVYDDEKTDLLKHWDDTFKYISRARAEGSKVLVHCKMGVSRSASVVIAYAMKAYNWDFKKAYEYVKKKRNCIKPNCSFVSQLETYQGILDAMKNREKLQRSKSETNLKSPCLAPGKESPGGGCQRQETRSETAACALLAADWAEASGSDLGRAGGRPKSWSPDNSVASMLFSDEPPGPTSVSMEHLNSEERTDAEFQAHAGSAAAAAAAAEMCPTCRTRTRQDELPCRKCFRVAPCAVRDARNRNSHLRIPCENGQTYSVSQNRIVYLPGSASEEPSDFVPYVRNRVIEFESQSGTPTADAGTPCKKSQTDRRGLVLNLTSQFETSCSKSGSPTDADKPADVADARPRPPQIVNSMLVKEEVWDPGERGGPPRAPTRDAADADSESPCPPERRPRREGDPFSDRLDRVFDREERGQGAEGATAAHADGRPSDGPSRQNSWSSHDSAVVLGFQGETREAPSRQSSWGSGDLRAGPGALPSRNSSWGSYDLRPTMQLLTEKSEKAEEPAAPFDKDVPWNPGTVRRTRQRLEEATTQAREAAPEDDDAPPLPRTELSACNPKLHGPKPYQTPAQAKDLKAPGAQLPEPPPSAALVHYASTPALSVQASLENASVCPDKMTVSQPDITLLREDAFPRSAADDDDDDDDDLPALSADRAPDERDDVRSLTVVDAAARFCSVRHQKQVLENLTNRCCAQPPKRCLSADESAMTSDAPKPAETEAQKSVSGMVQNLKKEFEAKSASRAPGESNGENSRQAEPPALPSEDSCVKNLVGKYEIKKNKHRETDCGRRSQGAPPGGHRKGRPDAGAQAQTRGKHAPLFLHNLKNAPAGEKVLVLERPPAKSPSPGMVVASVVAKAAAKKQQGKTHPLAHLTINPRHTNPVYNTM